MTLIIRILFGAAVVAAIGSSALARSGNQMMMSGPQGQPQPPPPPPQPQPGPGCVPSGHVWNIVINDDFTKDTSLNTSVFNPFVFNSVSGPITGYGGGPGVYEDGTGTRALSFSANGLQINQWNANGLSDNPNNYPGVGGISTVQNMGPGYYEAVIHPGSHHTALFRSGNNGSCTSPNDTINGPGGTEDDIQECFGPGTCGNNIHYGGYGTCHQSVSGPQYTSTTTGADTYGMYWSTVTGKVFCHNGATIYTNTSANGPFAPPSPLIADLEDGNGTDPMVVKSIRFWTDGGASGGGGGIACDVGPNFQGTIPAGAVAAGFTHCLANYDFTSAVPFMIGTNTYNFSQINTWLDCKMSGGVPLWWVATPPSDVYSGTATSPCSDYSIVTDPVDGKQAFARTFTVADVSNGSHSSQLRSVQTSSISGTYPTATMTGQTIPQQIYVEWRQRFSTPDSNVNLNGASNAIMAAVWAVSCCHFAGPYREDDWMESYTNIEAGASNDGLSFYPTNPELFHPAYDHTQYHTLARRFTHTSAGAAADCIYEDGTQIFNNGAQSGSTTTGNCVTFSWTAADTLARQIMLLDTGLQGYITGSPPVSLTGPITTNIEFIHVFTCATGNNGGSGSMNTGSCYTSTPITSNP